MKKLYIISVWLLIAIVGVFSQWIILSACFGFDTMPVVSHLVLSTDAHGHAVSQYSFAPDFCLSRWWDLVIIPVVALAFIIIHIMVKRIPNDQNNIEDYKLDLLLRIYVSIIMWTVIMTIADKFLLPPISSWPLDALFGTWCVFIGTVTAGVICYFGVGVRYALMAAPATTISLILSAFIVAGMEYGLIVGISAATWMILALFLGKMIGGLLAERQKQNSLPGIPLTPRPQA
jgi:hypothetical protein